jgi:hypothetical protein
MIFRQLFDQVSCTYSYLLASRQGSEALIIDPVLEPLPLSQRCLFRCVTVLVKPSGSRHSPSTESGGAIRGAL